MGALTGEGGAAQAQGQYGEQARQAAPQEGPSALAGCARSNTKGYSSTYLAMGFADVRAVALLHEGRLPWPHTQTPFASTRDCSTVEDEQSLVESKGRGNGCPVAQGCRLRPAILSLPVGICIGTFHRENMSLKVGTVPTGTDISGLRAVAQDCMACWIQPKCSLTRGAGAADIGVGRARV